MLEQPEKANKLLIDKATASFDLNPARPVLCSNVSHQRNELLEALRGHLVRELSERKRMELILRYTQV